jgi:cysteine desulfuration protein SufE
MQTNLDDIRETFSLIDDWEERYRYVIELGKALPALSDSERTDANKVAGCASQVWLAAQRHDSKTDPILTYKGDSDAHIVRGLVAITIAAYSGQKASAIATYDAGGLFAELGLSEHLTPQRSNGVRAMVERIRRDALAVISAAHPTESA